MAANSGGGWFDTKFDAMDTAWDKVPKTGAIGGNRFFLKANEKRRIMLLDDEPGAMFWEHMPKINGKWGTTEVCLHRNAIGPECPLCPASAAEAKADPRKGYAYYVGLFTIVDMTAWIDGKGKSHNYFRKVLAARMGSKEKPGFLAKLRRMSAAHKEAGHAAGLAGCIYDAFRSGAKTERVGDDWTFVERIPVDQIAAYAKKCGADVEKYPWVPIDFKASLPAPKTVAELRAIVASPLETSHGDADDEGSESDDIPF